VIISDATALIVLINIDKFELFKMMFENIIMTQEVYDEVTVRPSTKKFIDTEIKAGFLSIENYEDVKAFKEINFILDKGESASIALALEKNLPLIIDEKKGRKFAQNCGIEIIGLVGMLRFIYVHKLLSKKEISEIIKNLNQSDFRVSAKLMQTILET